MVSLLRCFSFSSKDERKKPVPHLVDTLNLGIKNLEGGKTHSVDTMNLGVNVEGGKMCVLIPKNTKFPTMAEEKIITVNDYQSTICVNVYEGESSFTKDNILLAVFNVDGFPPAPKGIAGYKLCFDVDANGTLKVSAVDTISCNLMKEITIKSEQRRLKKMLNAKNKLNHYANGIKQILLGDDPRYKGKLEVAPKEKKIMNAANETIKWLNGKNHQAGTIYEYEYRQKELDVLWNPIVTKLYRNAAAGGGPLPVASKEVKLPKSCSSAPPKAGSVLDVVD